MKDDREYTSRSDGSHTIINWVGVRQEDIDVYEDMIDEILNIDDLDERMNDIERLNWAVREDYPDIFENIRDEIQEITFK